MNPALTTALHDIGFYLVAVWAGVVAAGALLAGLTPLWRRWRARLRLSLGTGRDRGSPPTR